jgi:hypothetical protein
MFDVAWPLPFIVLICGLREAAFYKMFGMGLRLAR